MDHFIDLERGRGRARRGKSAFYLYRKTHGGRLSSLSYVESCRLRGAHLTLGIIPIPVSTVYRFSYLIGLSINAERAVDRDSRIASLTTADRSYALPALVTTLFWVGERRRRRAGAFSNTRSAIPIHPSPLYTRRPIINHDVWRSPLTRPWPRCAPTPRDYNATAVRVNARECVRECTRARVHDHPPIPAVVDTTTSQSRTHAHTTSGGEREEEEGKGW